ncbi:MAG: multicomponent Na+:H+ antiporter subunit MnhF [Bacteroidetes bacterium HLUCCA01]|nr:MAG: multicomponent Na+:H+ antiporter subunit MnhF [Bacteroidetes bacterium HLUCCA01]
MILAENDILGWVSYGVLIILSLSLAIATVRLIRGPSLSDRVIALDLIAFITVGFIATFAIYSGKHALMDAATVLALVAFLGTTAFARYIQNARKESTKD